MPLLGPWELIVILLIVVVIFGAGRLSQVGGALGKSVREFRRATDDHPSATTPAAVAAPANPAATPTTSAPAAPVAVVTEVTCASCGTINGAGKSFCGQCGTRLVRAA